MRIGGIHQVYTGKILVRRHDVQGILTRDIHEVRQTCSRTHKDALKSLFFQVFYRDGLAYDAVGDEFHAHLLKILNLYVYDGIRQSELRDTIFQYTTYLVQSLEYGDFESLLCHIASKAQTGRT